MKMLFRGLALRSLGLFRRASARGFTGRRPWRRDAGRGRREPAIPFERRPHEAGLTRQERAEEADRLFWRL
jgi:hypothetical protein